MPYLIVVKVSFICLTGVGDYVLVEDYIDFGVMALL